MPTNLHIHPNPPAVARAFTEYLLEQVQDRDYFTIALSGGSTPKLLFQLWATEYRTAFNWSAIHFFWGDERCVPPDDADSNFGVTKALLFDHIDIPAENIHRVRGEDDPAVETERYAQEIADNTHREGLFPSFDLVMLGMGSDGHTASIFPHQMELLTIEKVTAVADHPDSGQQRVSLSGPVINNAQQVAFLVTGASKQEKVAAILDKTAAAEAYPAAHIKPYTGELHWFLDAAAMG